MCKGLEVRYPSILEAEVKQCEAGVGGWGGMELGMRLKRKVEEAHEGSWRSTQGSQ